MLIVIFSFPAFAQSLTVISGKVTDAASGDPLPYVSVYFKGTKTGASTDFEGNYVIKTTSASDSLSASYIGYVTRVKRIKKGVSQVINFQLDGASTSLQEVTITPGENPAWRVMRQVVAHKDFNDKRALDAYQFESYNKIEIDIDNISEKMRKRKVMRQITQIFDSLGRLAGENGKPILPLFISESISDYYYNRSPEKTREEIKKTRITGVGVNEAGVVSQMIGSSFQQYNFYKNWINILGKDFVSPIADGWKLHYDYELQDSLFMGEDWVYKIKVSPKRKQDLAFNGTIWITKEDYAIRTLDLYISKEANLNFVEKIKIQQELERTPYGVWLPSKNRITIDVAEISENSAGMLAKFYTSNKNFVLNQPKEGRFYDVGIEVMNDSMGTNEQYWAEHRHDTLSTTEKNVYKMIDTIRNLPVVRTYIDIANLIVIGYKRVGKIDIGPYLLSYANNNIEGNRFRIGFRTNAFFSRRFNFESYLAYGDLDGRFKHGLEAKYLISKRPYTQIGASETVDIDQVSILDNNVQSNKLFYAFTRFGDIISSKPFMYQATETFIKTQLYRGLSQTFTLKNRYFNPLFDYSYLSNPSDPKTVTAGDFTVSEMVLETRYAAKEFFLQDAQNQQVSVNATQAPIFTFKYTRGQRNIGGGDFSYNKYNFNITQHINVGILGTGRYVLDLGYIPNTLPYPLLKVHLGNQTIAYNSLSFNLMNRFEFVSDKWVSLGYTHYFEGLGLNSIPLIRKLKWRFVATGKLLYGSVTDDNRRMSTITDPNTGVAVLPFRQMGNLPYAEVGYGIENIFRFVRIDFIHRLTYLDNPEKVGTKSIRPFGIKIGAQFKL